MTEPARREAAHMLDEMKASEFLGITRDQQVIDLMVRFAAAHTADLAARLAEYDDIPELTKAREHYGEKIADLAAQLAQAEQERDSYRQQIDEAVDAQDGLVAALTQAEQRGRALEEENKDLRYTIEQGARLIDSLQQRVQMGREALAATAGPLEIIKATECDDAAIALNPALKRMIVTAVDCVRAALSPPSPEGDR